MGPWELVTESWEAEEEMESWEAEAAAAEVQEMSVPWEEERADC